MYRIVIADDEEDIRELLAKNINRSQSGFEVVGKATNGSMAIELVKELRPDILITDICMPLLSGLDLIREIQKLGQQIKTVIISGYDDFSYARQALTLGVTDYLLKPFMPSEMYEVLDRIKEELERQHIMAHNIQEMQKRLKDNDQVMQEHLLKGLIESTLTTQQAEEGARRSEIDLNGQNYAAAIIKVHPEIPERKQTMKDLLLATKDPYFSNDLNTYLFQPNDKHIVMLFIGRFRNPKTFINRIRDGIGAISSSMEKYYDMTLHCILGGVYESWKNLPDSYQEALSVWRVILTPPEPVVCYDEEIGTGQNSPHLPWQRPKELEQGLLLSIQMGRTEKALDILNEILQYYESVEVKLSDFVSISLVELVFDISSTLMKSGNQVPLWEDQNVVEYLKKHFAYGSLSDAKNVLEEYIIKCCDTFSKVNESQGERIIFQVKELIERYLDCEELNLEMVSAKLFFSHNYIRQIFKQITGESFMEYLIRRRMETASRLLEHPSYKIQDVAIKTGYRNQRYFASCFKKYFGLTPTEYRTGLNEKK